MSQNKMLAVMLSKRANVLYLEHARILQHADTVAFMTEDGDLAQQWFNIPDKNTAFLLLGQGTSITNAAARKLAESQVMVGFCGTGGSPLFSATEPLFLIPISEYRPPEYMQAWVKMWLNEASRLEQAKSLMYSRVSLTQQLWDGFKFLKARNVVLDDALALRFKQNIAASENAEQLLLCEAAWAKALYAKLAQAYKIGFARNPGAGKSDTDGDVVNSLLDRGNYLAYGFSAVVLQGLGISFAFPLFHGKTRRGALVFDIADLFKDGLIMPLAFEYAEDPGEFRFNVIEHAASPIFEKETLLDYLFEKVKRLSQGSLR